ncbi:putative Ubiquitin-like domain-containing protein [Helianthus anomalus]
MSSASMNISIKNLEGRITCSLEAKPTDTISSVKAMIKIKVGISVDEQMLIFNRMVLGDDGTLFYFHVNSKSTLTLIRRHPKVHCLKPASQYINSNICLIKCWLF